MTVPSPQPRLDSVIQHPTRLAVVAFLSGCAEADFRTVRERLDMSDSALSKTVAALEAAEYLQVRKGHIGKRPRTWLALSMDGRRRLASHIAALQQIAAQAQEQAAHG
jgi:DNA-binding MarR family transcriptional regulator